LAGPDGAVAISSTLRLFMPVSSSKFTRLSGSDEIRFAPPTPRLRRFHYASRHAFALKTQPLP